MQDEKITISRFQLLCLGFISLLSPIIRLLPQHAVELSGSAAWFSALLTLVPVGLLFLVLNKFFKNARPNEGYAELFIRVLGKGFGKAVIIIYSLWLMFYTAFGLCSSADRYVTAAYQHTSAAIFIIIMLLLALIPTLGRFKILCRTTESFFPLLVLVLLLVFGFAFQDVDLNFLPPPTVKELPKILSSIPTIANILSLAVYVGFLEGRIREKEKRMKTIFTWLLLMVITVILLCVTTVGSLGADITSKLCYPFFVMIRNISVFNFIERLESIVLALWVITDFAFISVLLFIVDNNLRIVFSYPATSAEGAKFLDFKNGRYLIWINAAIVLVIALLLSPNSFFIATLSKKIVPIINLIFTFGLLPLIVIIGMIRKRI